MTTLKSNLQDQLNWLSSNADTARMAGFEYAPFASSSKMQRPTSFNFDNPTRRWGRSSAQVSLSAIGHLELENFRIDNNRSVQTSRPSRESLQEADTKPTNFNGSKMSISKPSIIMDQSKLISDEDLLGIDFDGDDCMLLLFTLISHTHSLNKFVSAIEVEAFSRVKTSRVSGEGGRQSSRSHSIPDIGCRNGNSTDWMNSSTATTAAVVAKVIPSILETHQSGLYDGRGGASEVRMRQQAAGRVTPIHHSLSPRPPASCSPPPQHHRSPPVPAPAPSSINTQKSAGDSLSVAESNLEALKDQLERLVL